MNGTCACGKAGRIRRGMCNACYTRWYRARTPEERYRPTLEERFWSKVDRRGSDECWPWSGSAFRGYGEFHVSAARGRVKAHTFAVELVTGAPCPPGQGGLHRCDNPPCVNPAHVYYGTQQQNAADMVERKRHQVGEQRPNARLTSTQVVEIRERFAAGELSPILCAEYDVSSANLSRIVTGQHWKHAGGPIMQPGRRKPRCKNGHQMTADNTYVRPNGRYHDCRTCAQERQRARDARKREKRQLREQVATGRTAVASERAQDQLHADRATGAA